MSVSQSYLQSAIKRLNYYKDLGDKTLARLQETDLHYQPNESCNSIAIIIQHMAGNMLSRWTDILYSDGEKEWRNRDAEFEEQYANQDELEAYWNKGWDCCMSSLQSFTEEDLVKTIYIRGEGLSLLDAINRQLAHYPYHVGQIILLAKIIKGDAWQSLSIEKGGSQDYNQEMRAKG